MSTRAEQKLRTRRALMDAALSQLSADRGFGSLSLREVAREAGIAPTSFYRHFSDLDELGLALVDEGGVALTATPFAECLEQRHHPHLRCSPRTRARISRAG